MTINMKYERKNFWNRKEYTEDKKEHATFEDLKKAFQFLGKNRDVAFELDSIVYFWNSYDDFTFNIITKRIYDHTNPFSYEEFRIPFDKEKHEKYNQYR